MELACSAGIQKIGIKAKEKHGIVTRTVRMTLVREFDPLIARAIGGDAQELLSSLESKGATKVEMPIDGIQGQCKLSGEKGDDVTIKNVVGIKAIGKASKADEDGDGPRLELVFDFPFSLPAWEFFGQNVGGRAELLFTKSQLELGLGVTEGASGKKAKKRDLVALAFPDADDRDDDEPPAEEQDVADSPAEAEALRQKRLDAEHAERVAALVAEMSPKVVVTELDGGGFLAALTLESGEELRDTGDTEEAAREHVLGLFASAQPRYVPLPETVTWGDVVEASAESGAAEDAAPLPVPPVADAPKTLLKAPRGKRASKMKVVLPGSETPVDLEEAVAKLEEPAPGMDTDGRPLCAPDCEDEHDHTSERTAF